MVMVDEGVGELRGGRVVAIGVGVMVGVKVMVAVGMMMPSAV